MNSKQKNNTLLLLSISIVLFPLCYNIINAEEKIKIYADEISVDEIGEKVITHLFRKSIGKEMLNGTHGEKASAIPVISKHLRHSKPSMTVDHYLKASLESVKEAW